ncbi:MAG: glycosyltransferase family 4 protein [Deltaproteobacteria bacterium]|nr:glycosyltransferase family 4 protein [Deltaproteobacteria bacterium]
MRILYHHRTASKDGQAVHIEELISALSARGHQIEVVAPSIGPSTAGAPEAMGSRVDWVHRLKARLPKAMYETLELSYSAVAYQRLARAVRTFRPDFIYERYNLFLLSGVILRQRFNLPLLLEVNAPLAEERNQFGGMAMPRFAQWAETQTWRQADVVLPVTQVLGQYVEERGVPPERIAVIHNGINEAHFAQAPKPEDAKRQLGLTNRIVLGFTGFIRDWHRVDRVVRWLATPDAPPNAMLVVVGDGPARPELETLAKTLGVTDRLLFTGVIDRKAVPAHVAAFDIALQPAVVPYASPLKMFEYLALGKAIIAPRRANIEELLTHDENAWLFTPDVPGDFEKALQALVGDADLRSRLATNAALTIGRKRLTWSANAERIEALATEAIRQRTDRSGASGMPPHLRAA